MTETTSATSWRLRQIRYPHKTVEFRDGYGGGLGRTRCNKSKSREKDNIHREKMKTDSRACITNWKETRACEKTTLHLNCNKRKIKKLIQELVQQVAGK